MASRYWQNLIRDYVLLVPAEQEDIELHNMLLSWHVNSQLSGARRNALGYATLGDLLGPVVAKSIFQPMLLEPGKRWGTIVFAEFKVTYEILR